MSSMRYVVLDIETTGLSASYHKITEIGAVKVTNDKIKGTYDQLINPLEKIPSFITRLTGIDNKMVKDAPPIDKALPKFLKFVGNNVIIAHNATFDHGFITKNAQQLNLSFANAALCTRKLSTRLLPDLPSKRLGSICEHLNIPHPEAHRAMPDVLVTNEIFRHLYSLLEQQGLNKMKDILNYQNLPRRHIEKLAKIQ